MVQESSECDWVERKWSLEDSLQRETPLLWEKLLCSVEAAVRSYNKRYGAIHFGQARTDRSPDGGLGMMHIDWKPFAGNASGPAMVSLRLDGQKVLRNNKEIAQIIVTDDGSVGFSFGGKSIAAIEDVSQRALADLLFPELAPNGAILGRR